MKDEYFFLLMCSDCQIKRMQPFNMRCSFCQLFVNGCFILLLNSCSAADISILMLMQMTVKGYL